MNTQCYHGHSISLGINAIWRNFLGILRAETGPERGLVVHFPIPLSVKFGCSGHPPETKATTITINNEYSIIPPPISHIG